MAMITCSFYWAFHSYQKSWNFPIFHRLFKYILYLINEYGICYCASAMVPISDKLSIKNLIIIILFIKFVILWNWMTNYILTYVLLYIFINSIVVNVDRSPFLILIILLFPLVGISNDKLLYTLYIIYTYKSH